MLSVIDDDHSATDNAVRLIVYNTLAERCVAPTSAEIARVMNVPVETVASSFERLAAAHVLVLDGTGELLMAMPFSAVPTKFRVRAGGQAWWANCAWDAFGIAAALDRDADIATECPDCSAPLEVSVRGGAVTAAESVGHFAVPAAHWWDDIIFT